MDYPGGWYRLRDSDDNEKKQAAELIRVMAEALWEAQDILGYRSPKYGKMDADRYIWPVLRRFWDWR
jgi:hypothetical protein